MAKVNEQPTSLSEAIAKLETAGQSKANNFKEILEKDYAELRKNLDDLKPYLDELKINVENQVKTTKSEVEGKIKQNPWLTLGIVGIFAFVIGWILGQKNKD